MLCSSLAGMFSYCTAVALRRAFNEEQKIWVIAVIERVVMTGLMFSTNELNGTRYIKNLPFNKLTDGTIFRCCQR